MMTETASSGRMLLTDRAEPSEDVIIVPTSSVDITDVSRMDLDLKRQAQVEQRSKADPHAADKHFVQLLVKLLQKVGFKADLLFVDHLQSGIIPRPNHSFPTLSRCLRMFQSRRKSRSIT